MEAKQTKTNRMTATERRSIPCPTCQRGAGRACAGSRIPGAGTLGGGWGGPPDLRREHPARIAAVRGGAVVTRPTLAEVLRTLRACPESVQWAERYGSDWAGALAECPRRYWLFWLYAELEVRRFAAREPLVLCAAACARAALHRLPPGEERPLRAIEVAEAWGRGEATLNEVSEARDAAFAVTSDAAFSAAAAANAATAPDAVAASEAARYGAAAATSDDAIVRREIGHHLLAGLDAYVAAVGAR